jgi:hypothetical protein
MIRTPPTVSHDAGRDWEDDEIRLSKPPVRNDSLRQKLLNLS